MAPAIAHFLVGAGIALILAAPVAFRYDVDRSWGLWIVPIGGLWGLLPDIHNVAPVYRAQLRAVHYSPWMDLFALHHSLDRPAVRAMYLESVFCSILFFTLAVGAFSIAQSARGRPETNTSRDRAVLVAGGTLVATGYAGAVVSILLLHLDRYAVLAALIGRDGTFAGWLALAAFSVLAGVGLAVGLEGLAAVRDPPEPFARIGFGGLIALGGWLLASFLVPLWLRYRTGATLPVPSLEWAALLSTGTFVGVFTLVYSLLRGASRVRNDRDT